ncbi:nucleotidyltransferase domain-containing protein [Paractinoplanes durhamensis]|uniref:Polymerase nucleotidyl transferase domain-containing protein n=1 Tax=Paractinoplanes durhamensis TaxID=113563 RepID=A0ABQ3ZA19_9ACTN|nr:nucleotidyltransferase domain-containing protein [Actinoplanes durhamensis]GIE06680.1 hypothetical protein Adu01nite_80300 [Actinoplanes durhamensis]
MIYKTTNIYLEAVDQALPGFVRGLYIVGSAALNAWQPGASDIDAIIYTSRPASGDDLAVLAKIHQNMPPRPYFDPVYLEPALAGEWPMHQEPAPFVVDGALQPAGKPCGELTPVVGLVLQKYGIRVRGPEINLKIDPAELLRYNLENLRDYWQAGVVGADEQLAAMDQAEPVDADSVVWTVTGPARLHRTAATGDIIAKTAAAGYLAELFPRYAGLAARAAAHRAGTPQVFTVTDLRAAIASVNEVAEDAWRRFGPLTT